MQGQAALTAASLIGLGALAGSAVASGVLVWLVRAWARSIGFVDRPNERKFHRAPISYGGGLAIVAALWLTVGGGVGLAVLAAGAPPSWLPLTVARHLPGVVSRLPELGVIFGCSMLLLAVGLYDDMRGMSPLPKLCLQILAGVLVAAGGIRLTAFVPWTWAHYLMTIGWVVVITNSINLLDNMDGLSSGVAAITSGAFALVALQGGQWFVALFLLALVGSLLGFLWYNYHPASIFMGDAGSLNIGFLLAVLTIKGTYYQPGAAAHTVLLPLMVLAIPLFDTTSVILLRIRLGKPIYIGDTNHVSHRLVRMGMSVPRAVLTIYLMTLITSTAAVLLPRLDGLGAWLIGMQTLLTLLLVATLERESRLARERAAAEDDAPPPEAPRAPVETPLAEAPLETPPGAVRAGSESETRETAS